MPGEEKIAWDLVIQPSCLYHQSQFLHKLSKPNALFSFPLHFLLAVEYLTLDPNVVHVWCWITESTTPQASVCLINPLGSVSILPQPPSKGSVGCELISVKCLAQFRHVVSIQ